MLTLDGKTCLISGAASGIGERTTLLFDSLGAKVVALDIDEARGKRLEAKAKNGNVEFRRIDLRKRAEVARFGTWCEQNLERIDSLINNALAPMRNTVLNVTMEDWDSELALSLTGSMLLSRLAAKTMISKKIPGKIILMSAVQAERPMESSFSYSVVKGGMISMARSLAVDLGVHGILVTAVMPGPIHTADKNRLEEAPAEVDIKAATLLGRMGKRAEVASLLAFLVSDLNTFMTGNTIVIDGGRMVSRKPDPVWITTDYGKTQLS